MKVLVLSLNKTGYASLSTSICSCPGISRIRNEVVEVVNNCIDVRLIVIELAFVRDRDVGVSSYAFVR